MHVAHTRVRTNANTRSFARTGESGRWGSLCVKLLGNNNNILYSSQREIKAVVRPHNEERNYLNTSKS